MMSGMRENTLDKSAEVGTYMPKTLQRDLDDQALPDESW